MPNPKLSSLTIPIGGVPTTFDLGGAGGERIEGENQPHKTNTHINY